MGADVNASFSLLKDSKCSVVHLKDGKLGAKGGSLAVACFFDHHNRMDKIMQWAWPI